MKQLNKAFIEGRKADQSMSYPKEDWDRLPPKVLQFGTGVLLRGLPDYFIDKANKAGVFNGRIIVVKSTAKGKAEGFDEQDGLYTICVKGVQDGKEVDEQIINSSIEKVITAAQWEEILTYADHPEMKIVLSNTTEVGIVYDKHDYLFALPPASFPAKLTAFLYRRYKYFKGDTQAGMVIVPTELINDNGSILKEIVLKLAHTHQLEEAFINWLESANYFCNSLVDRIVPGKLSYAEQEEMENRLGYRDDLMIMAEPFRLWAIQSDSEEVKKVLSFSEVDEGMVIADDIKKFKELKLRLLNGTHTFSCGLAVLAGFDTVKEALANPAMETFVKGLLFKEIVPTVLAQNLPEVEVNSFAKHVLDRFRNQSLDHKWINITLNYSSKMEMRNVALLNGFAKHNGNSPEYMALGFAAYLLFMKGNKRIDEVYKGYTVKGYYPINDEQAEYFAQLWKQNEGDDVVDKALKNQKLWKTDLTLIPHFSDRVKHYLSELQAKNVLQVIISVTGEMRSV
ncbi:tagaturonate reductase [Olivibacter sp. SDN3]|uniref:tagaturonate reductase n=1 Tax=Olivibacter sp. SDN3 TaxID=2764720 RepID=UPI00165100A3|nr:tagaturonate reductase [Olivibacter sp. SDN3]QNL49261.1 tagaturonate reductase [Olivibacter sp. SDN3]